MTPVDVPCWFPLQIFKRNARWRRLELTSDGGKRPLATAALSGVLAGASASELVISAPKSDGAARQLMFRQRNGQRPFESCWMALSHNIGSFHGPEPRSRLKCRSATEPISTTAECGVWGRRSVGADPEWTGGPRGLDLEEDLPPVQPVAEGP